VNREAPGTTHSPFPLCVPPVCVRPSSFSPFACCPFVAVLFCWLRVLGGLFAHLSCPALLLSFACPVLNTAAPSVPLDASHAETFAVHVGAQRIGRVWRVCIEPHGPCCSCNPLPLPPPLLRAREARGSESEQATSKRSFRLRAYVVRVYVRPSFVCCDPSS
jgi:hypothetical protein